MTLKIGSSVAGPNDSSYRSTNRGKRDKSKPHVASKFVLVLDIDKNMVFILDIGWKQTSYFRVVPLSKIAESSCSLGSLDFVED